jgi:hypothetical protein
MTYRTVSFNSIKPKESSEGNAKKQPLSDRQNFPFGGLEAIFAGLLLGRGNT